MSIDFKGIGFIGAGNMAQAIGFCIINQGIIKPSEIIVSAPTERNLTMWCKKGVKTTNTNFDVVKNSHIIFIAVKPQYFEDAIRSLNGDGSVTDRKIFVSIMAGKTIDYVDKTIHQSAPIITNYEVIRIMPNTPCLVGSGYSVMCHGPYVEDVYINEVKKLMSCTGTCEVISEQIIDAVSAVIGSGPAYIYMVIESLADGAVRCGVPRDLAMRAAAHTVVGAGKMVTDTGKHPGQLKDEVCSPGGTTIAAVHELENRGVRGAFMNAVQAATNRAVQLSNPQKN